MIRISCYGSIRPLEDSAEPGEPPRACQVAAQLQREGADLWRVFTELVAYTKGPSMAAERKKRGKQIRNIINRGVRNNDWRLKSLAGF